MKFFPTAKKQPDGIERDSHNDAGALKCGQEYISHILVKDAAFFFFIVQSILFGFFFGSGVNYIEKTSSRYCKHTNSCNKESTNTASAVFKQAPANTEFLRPKHTELVQQINPPTEWAACVLE